jgi:hypothetical protein
MYLYIHLTICLSTCRWILKQASYDETISWRFLQYVRLMKIMREVQLLLLFDHIMLKPLDSLELHETISYLIITADVTAWQGLTVAAACHYIIARHREREREREQFRILFCICQTHNRRIRAKWKVQSRSNQLTLTKQQFWGGKPIRNPHQICIPANGEGRVWNMKVQGYLELRSSDRQICV